MMVAGGVPLPIRMKPVNSARGVLKYAVVMAVLLAAAYVNTLHVPFIFDDQINILDNPSIRHLGPIRQVLTAPPETGIAGRPVVNASLALNYAVSGDDPWSYHVLNLLIHLAAALCLLGIIRRTLRSDRLAGDGRPDSTLLAFACAALWALHPLQTQAVTYTIQRCESLMGLCFLLTFYFAIRGWQAISSRPWHLAAILSFIVGAGTKEVIVVAPFVLFVYDFLFFHRDWKKALIRSPLLYSGMSLALVGMGFLVAAGGTASSATGRMDPSVFDYWMTQPGVILHYLGLVFWPYRLCIDYGWPIANFEESWPAVAILLLFVITASFLLVKGHPLSFPLVFFLAVLAPTSLFPLPDAAFDHRMYLPSIAVVVIGVTGVWALMKRLADKSVKDDGQRSGVVSKGTVYLLILLLPLLGLATYLRNMDYRSDVAIWTDAVRKRPGNGRAQANLGNALLQEGKVAEAFVRLHEALRIETENARRSAGAAYEGYLRMRPAYAKIHDNLAWIGLMKGNPDVAIQHLHEALMADPAYAAALAHTGIALHFQGKQAESLTYFHRAIRLKPFDPAIRVNLAVTLRLQGRLQESIAQFQEALRMAPRNWEAHYGIGMALREQGRYAEAVGHFREALRFKPDYGPAREVLERIRKEQETGEKTS